MKTPNLIPTPVTDKNGKLTTVHKKPQAHPSAPNLSLPTLNTPSTPALTPEQRHEIIEQSHQRLYIIQDGPTSGEGGNWHADKIHELMLTYPDHAITSMHQYFMLDIDQYKEAKPYIERIEFLSLLTRPNQPPLWTTVHEYLAFRTIPTTKTPNFDLDIAIIRALHTYPQLPTMDHYADADEETKGKIIALIATTRELSMEYFTRHFQTLVNTSSSSDDEDPEISPMELGIPLEIKHPNEDQRIRLHGDDLINLVINNPEHASLITRYITKEGISDPALLKEIVETNTPTLRDGML